MDFPSFDKPSLSVFSKIFGEIICWGLFKFLISLELILLLSKIFDLVGSINLVSICILDPPPSIKL